MEKELQAKVDKLQSLLKSYGCVAVAFSAGVDSTVLLKAAQDAFVRGLHIIAGKIQHLVSSQKFLDMLKMFLTKIEFSSVK